MTIMIAVAVTAVTLLFSNAATAQRSRSYGGNDTSKTQTSNTATTSGGQTASKAGAAGSTVATAVTPEEAAKKYPPPSSGKYPMGERDPHKSSGIVTSPYPPHTDYDCSTIPHNGLVLDTHVNKVFVRP